MKAFDARRRATVFAMVMGLRKTGDRMSPRRIGTSSPSHIQNGGEGTVGAVLGGEDADGFSELEAVGYCHKMSQKARLFEENPLAPGIRMGRVGAR